MLGWLKRWLGRDGGRTASGKDESQTAQAPAEEMPAEVKPVPSVRTAAAGGNQRDAAAFAIGQANGLAYAALLDRFFEDEQDDSLLLGHLARRISSLKGGEELASFLENEMRDANDRLAERGAAASLAVLVVCGEKLYWAALGDARVYIFRMGAVAKVTREPVYREDTWEAGRDALAAYLGVTPMGDIDLSLSPLYLLSGDAVLLISDALWRVLGDQRIASEVRAAQSLEDAVRALVRSARAEDPDGRHLAALLGYDGEG